MQIQTTALQTPPVLEDWVQWVWRCWLRLSDERPHHVTGVGLPMGGMMLKSIPGRISWASVERWCEAHGFGPDRRDFLDVCIRAMDSKYLKWWQGQQEK